MGGDRLVAAVVRVPGVMEEEPPPGLMWARLSAREAFSSPSVRMATMMVSGRAAGWREAKDSVIFLHDPAFISHGVGHPQGDGRK